ncbi:hypothetical protein QBC39DRAFT_4102 [Podospora conica]|nr:hypothetical protein QBC39DRAFT_4102 [Schizothecium conicum]
MLCCHPLITRQHPYRRYRFGDQEGPPRYHDAREAPARSRLPPPSCTQPRRRPRGGEELVHRGRQLLSGQHTYEEPITILDRGGPRSERNGGEFLLSSQPDFQPIPSCWVGPRRLPRRVSGHLHLERELLISFTPPQPRSGLGRCHGALQELGRGGRRQRNPTLITLPTQSARGPKESSSPVGCFLAGPFHFRIWICSPGNQNTLWTLPGANPC